MTESVEHYNGFAADEAQKEYCEKNKRPMFAPERYCPTCHKEIYGMDGYSVEYASKHLITGCPFCKTSFCD